MRILKDFKMPKMKFPKFKFGEIEEFKVDVEEIKTKEVQKQEKKQYKTTNYKTIKEMFYDVSQKYEDRPCILEKFDPKGSFETITYGKLKEDITAFGTAINDLLKMKNQKIVILGETTYEWYVTYLSVLCGSGVVVPIDKELPINEIENVIRRSGASIVVYSPRKKDAIKKVENNLPGVEFFIEMYDKSEIIANKVGYDYLLEMGRKLVAQGNNNYEIIEVLPEDFKLLVFTSGTTSNAKGVMISSLNLAENINAIHSYVNLLPEDRLLSILPLHHTYESTIGFLAPLSYGASVAVCQGLKYIVSNLNETKPTALLGVPLLIENLYKKINLNIKKSKKETVVNSMIHLTNALRTVNVDIKRKVFKDIYDGLGGRLRIIVSAAAPIDPKVGKWIEDIGITFLQGYGLTETAPIAALTPDYETKVGSAGRAIPSAELKIDSPNENNEGEILIKTPTLMIGYYEDKKATDEVIEIIDGERWFHSGDVGYIDKNGFLYITGRCKNVIVTQNGKNIYPEEIELLLSDIKEIQECFVYGKDNKDDKELIITAKVIPNYDEIEAQYGKNKTEKEIYDIIWEKIKEVNRKLTSYKAIKRLEIKNGEFEKTTTMKIKRYIEANKD